MKKQLESELREMVQSIKALRGPGEPESIVRAALTAGDLDPAAVSYALNVLVCAMADHLSAWKESGILRSCDFCHRTQEEVGYLVVGPTAAICDSCSLIALDIVEESKRSPRKGLINKAKAFLSRRTF